LSLKKDKDKIRSYTPKESPIPRRTGRLTVGRKIILFTENRKETNWEMEEIVKIVKEVDSEGMD
jgi:hypothetical protein